jgi:hypothetical protein
MRTKSVTIYFALLAAAVVLVPFPSRVAEEAKAQFIFEDGRPVPGLKVTQGWECFGLSGEGREEATTSASGIVRFPPRAGYGSVTTRVLGKLFSFVTVHSSYGANVRLDVCIDDPFRAVFAPPLYKPLEPFTTSGSYIDLVGRCYFPQERGEHQYLSVSGDFMHNAKDIKVVIASRKANPQGGANVKPPSSADTNQAPVAAASRHSP